MPPEKLFNFQAKLFEIPLWMILSVTFYSGKVLNIISNSRELFILQNVRFMRFVAWGALWTMRHYVRLFIHGKVFNSQYYSIKLFILASFKSLPSFRFSRFVVSNFLTSEPAGNFRAKSYYTVCVWLFSHGKVFNINNYNLEYFFLGCFKSVQTFVQTFGFMWFVVPKILASRLKSATQYKPDFENPVGIGLKATFPIILNTFALCKIYFL